MPILGLSVVPNFLDSLSIYSIWAQIIILIMNINIILLQRDMMN